MSETSPPAPPPDRSGQRAGRGLLEVDVAARQREVSSEHGSTSIADAVVTKIASIAAREVGGVHDLGGGTARTIGG